MSKRRIQLTYSEDGVLEVFNDNASKLYMCDETTCTCTYYKEHWVPCHHVLLTREKNGLSVFSIECFDWHYRRDLVGGGVGSSNDMNPVDAIDESAPEFPSEFDVDEEEVDTVTLSDNEKYKIIMPILSNIANLVSCHSTNTFLRYVDEFRNLENMVRRGKSISPQSDHTSPSSSVSVAPIPEQPPQEQSAPLQSSTATAPIVGVIEELGENPNAQPASKFNLNFKTALTTKGRPKNRGKQFNLNFNRTSLDRKENRGKRGNSGQPKTQKKRQKVVTVLKNMQASD